MVKYITRSICWVARFGKEKQSAETYGICQDTDNQTEIVMKPIIFIFLVFMAITSKTTPLLAQSENYALSVSVTDILNVNNSDISKYQIELSENNSVSGKALSNTLSYQKPRAGKKTIKGMLIGVGIGGLAGGTAAAVSYKECNDPEPWACLFHFQNRGEAFTAGAIFGGAVGGIAGIIIGAIADSKDKPVRKPSFDISLFHPMKFQPSKRLLPTATLKMNLK